MRKSLAIISTIILLVFATSAFAQIRGKARQQGVITDKETGKPVVGATVTLSLSSSNTEPIVVKTDKGGHWTAVGMTNGVYNVDVTADGYNPAKGTVQVNEVQMGPLIQTKLVPAPKVEQTTVPMNVKPTPLVPQEAIDAIKEGQELLKATDNVKENAAKAAADFERALPMIPTDKPEIASVRIQVQEVLAQAYYKAGNLKSAIATLEKLNVVDPFAATTTDANQVPRQILLANLYLENHQLDEAKQLIEKLPESAVTDANVYINMGILFLNNKKPGDAETYLTKAVKLDPKSFDAFYYRGLALAQQKKNKEAKADFEQVLQLAPPDSAEAKDAKTLIAGLK